MSKLSPTLAASSNPNFSNDKKYFITLVRAENDWVERARKNPIFFYQYLTEFTPSQHQIEWMSLIFNPNEHSRINIIAFPGSGKSDTMVYCMAYLIGRWPWLTNAIVSVSEDQAVKRLATIRDLIDHNSRFHNVFPWIKKDTRRKNTSNALNIWSSRITNKNPEIEYSVWRSYITQHGESKDNTISAAGITSKGIPGIRITGILGIDDAHDQENSSTQEQCKKVIDTFDTTLITRMVPRTDSKIFIFSKIVSICTRWNVYDFPGNLADRTKKDGSKIWNTLVTAIEDDKGNPTWPEVWSAQAIQDRADEQGGKESPMFRLSYMNDAQGRSHGEITPDMIQDLPSPLPELSEVYITVDFAHKTGLQHDFTVYTFLGRDKARPYNMYTLDIERFKSGKIDDKVKKLADFFDKCYETYGLLVNYVLFEDRDSQAEIERLQLDYPMIPVKVIKIKTAKDSNQRYKMVSNRCQAKCFYANKAMKYYNAMVSELVNFPGKHDDIVDTLSLPFQLPSWNEVRGRAHYELIPNPIAVRL